jgi:2-methylisocitrate lyase-like PEP mutase family enzyme
MTAKFPVRQVSPTESRRKLRELLAAPGAMELPGPYDAVTAQLIEQIGFPALWAGGLVGSATRLGAPDANVMTMSEQLSFASSVVEATNLPVVADIDNGYGEALMVTRTVQAFERAGLAALVLEDQGSPKHCTFYENLPLHLISKEEFVAKIEAAVDARRDDKMMIWARTDAITATSVDDALDRAHAAVDAGADAVFTPSASLDALGKVGAGWGRAEPLCMSSFNFPELTLAQVAELGYSLRLHPLPGILAALAAVKKAYKQLFETGSFVGADVASLTIHELEALTGGADVDAIDSRYRATSGRS